MTTFFKSLGILLLPFFVALVILIGGDLAALLPEADRFLGGGLDLIALLSLLLGLYLWTGLCLLLISAGLMSLFAAPDPLASLLTLRRGLLSALRDRSREPLRGARWLAGLFSGALFLVGNVRAILFFIENYNTAKLIAIAASALIALWLLFCLALWVVLTRLLAKLGRWPGLRHVIHARSALGLSAFVGLSVALVAIVFEREIFKEIDGWVLYLLALAFFSAALVLLIQPLRWAERLRPKLSLASILVTSAFVLLMLVGISLAPTNNNARALLLSHGRDASLLLQLWSSLSDVDGDGASSLLGGGDCDPWDRYVHPGALDIPDNGVDEDCFDGDFTRPQEATKGPTLTHPKLGPTQPDILIFSIDTCRRDALGSYGNTQKASPNLDKFAASAVIFDDAIPAASWTMPSFSALLSGRYASEIPRYYGAIHPQKVPRTVPLLQQRLAQSGYKTVAVTAGLQLDKLGLNRGFDDWQALTRTPRGNYAQKVADAGAVVLNETPLDKPLFLWVHAIDLHYPYEAPRKHNKFGRDAWGKYLAELNYVDTAFASFVKAIKDSGRDERSIVVVFADHGEAFGEHGFYYHGNTTYAEELRIPLLIRTPNSHGQRVTGPVALIDLNPTLLDLAGLDTDKHLRGISLAPALQDQGQLDLSQRAIFSEQTRYTRDFSITTSDYQLRFDQSHNYVELFDRKKDPSEQDNLVDILPDKALEMRRKLNMKMAPIAYLVGQKLGDVLLRTLPADYHVASGTFVQGPGFAGFKLEKISAKKLQASIVLASNGPLQGKRFELSINLYDEGKKRLGGGKMEVGAGVYHPERWRPGDLVQDRFKVNFSKALTEIHEVCIGLKVDKKSFAVVLPDELEASSLCQKIGASEQLSGQDSGADLDATANTHDSQ